MADQTFPGGDRAPAGPSTHADRPNKGGPASATDGTVATTPDPELAEAVARHIDTEKLVRDVGREAKQAVVTASQRSQLNGALVQLAGFGLIATCFVFQGVEVANPGDTAFTTEEFFVAFLGGLALILLGPYAARARVDTEQLETDVENVTQPAVDNALNRLREGVLKIDAQRSRDQEHREHPDPWSQDRG